MSTTTKTLPDFTQGLENLGFANYETYNLWDYYRNMQNWTVAAKDLQDLASTLKRKIEVGCVYFDQNQGDFYSNLMRSAIEQINYLEVAQAMFDEWRPAPK